MPTRLLDQALAQVQELQDRVLARQRFRGYSGPARALSGVAAVATAAGLAQPPCAGSVTAQLYGWGGLFAFALAANYGALLYWFLHDPKVNRDWRKLRPTLDVFPPLVVGGLLTIAMLMRGEYHYLFAAWMCCYGLANLASRHVLPRAISLVGLFYVFCGAACLFAPGLAFTNPWPMGIVFGVGELAGGAILYFDESRGI